MIVHKHFASEIHKWSASLHSFHYLLHPFNIHHRIFNYFLIIQFMMAKAQQFLTWRSIYIFLLTTSCDLQIYNNVMNFFNHCLLDCLDQNLDHHRHLHRLSLNHLGFGKDFRQPQQYHLNIFILHKQCISHSIQFIKTKLDFKKIAFHMTRKINLKISLATS